MTYGNKCIFVVVLLSLLFFVGCEMKMSNFHYDLYDGYTIRGKDGTIQLYKGETLISVEDENYKIKEIKYNSDVVCVKLDNGKYYMIYYVDASVYGPYTKETLEATIREDSTMTFEEDFQSITKIEGLIYE